MQGTMTRCQATLGVAGLKFAFLPVHAAAQLCTPDWQAALGLQTNSTTDTSLQVQAICGAV